MCLQFQLHISITFCQRHAVEQRQMSFGSILHIYWKSRAWSCLLLSAWKFGWMDGCVRVCQKHIKTAFWKKFAEEKQDVKPLIIEWWKTRLMWAVIWRKSRRSAYGARAGRWVLMFKRNFYFKFICNNKRVAAAIMQCYCTRTYTHTHMSTKPRWNKSNWQHILYDNQPWGMSANFTDSSKPTAIILSKCSRNCATTSSYLDDSTYVWRLS